MRLASNRPTLLGALAAFLLASLWTLAAAAPSFPPPDTAGATLNAHGAEFALAERLRQEAVARRDRATESAALARRRQAESARARLQNEERQQAGLVALALRRRQLAAGFVTLGPVAPEDGRARVLLAGLARAVTIASERSDDLTAEGAALARRQRAAAAAKEQWAARQAAAILAMRAADRRWRWALQSYAAAAAQSLAGGYPPVSLRAELVASDPLTLARAAFPARPRPTRAISDHKRAMQSDLKLDRRLLRTAAPMTAARARRLGAPALPTEPLLPIAGRLQVGTSPGFAIAASVDQVVSSPVSGRVMFAEPFVGLGPLLIIDRGEGYHVVLTGMTRLDVRRGASLVAGQSVGEIVAREDGPARLHFELRYRGLPIDPAPWLAAYHDKVRS